MAKKRINKRKFNSNNTDDKKSGTIDRKELKHLKTFGEQHPINDKKLCLEDLCVKRVFDDNNENNNDKNGGKMVAEINKTNKNQSEDEDESSTDYYEQLLDVFGKKKVDDNPESDASSDESTENDHSTNKAPREYEDIDVDQCEDDENDDNLNNVDNLDDDGDDDDNEEKTNPIDDNFIKHFFTDFSSNEIESLEKALKQPSMLETAQHEFPSLGKFNEIRTRIDCFNNIRLSNHQIPKTLNDIKQIKPILKENIPKTMLKLVKSSTKLTTFQLELLSLITTYKNIYYPQRTMENSEQIRLIYSLHTLNHVLRTRQRIMLHNQKIKANKMKNEDLKDEYRDQGLTRPKVLILLPFKHSAYLTVNMLISLLFGDCKDKTKINLMNYKRFCTEFAPESAETVVSSRKPEDYKQLFAGNSDDSFRIGMAVTRKSFKLYSNFYQSDIIIASPLGLRMIIGAIDDHDNGKNKKTADEQDYDFLSSIDIVIMDQSDIFLMQNWEHIQLIFDHLHLKPKNDKNFKNLNYLRVKLWTLELWSKYYYQLLMFNSISTTLLQGFFNKHSTNYGGRIIFPLLDDRTTIILPIDNIYLPIRQIFHHFDCDTHSQMADERFKFFTEKILPKFRNNEQTIRTMIYVPSYFDYVRLRNYFRREDISFTQICEYSPPGKVAKARHIFFYGGRHFLLYTERYHFFNRSAIKGIRHLIFYQPPTYGKFYEELINSMNQTNQGTRLPTTYDRMSVTILYNRKYDLLTILPLIGEKLSSKLLTSGTTATLTFRMNMVNINGN